MAMRDLVRNVLGVFLIFLKEISEVSQERDKMAECGPR